MILNKREDEILEHLRSAVEEIAPSSTDLHYTDCVDFITTVMSYYMCVGESRE